MLIQINIRASVACANHDQTMNEHGNQGVKKANIHFKKSSFSTNFLKLLYLLLTITDV